MIQQMQLKEFSGSLDADDVMEKEKRVRYDFKLKTRDEHIKDISDPKAEYDLLIVGGGASGAGVALEAASRGLKCAVIDKYDFASGTSSRSTKMAHGGIRYFEQMMFMQGDPVQNYEMLREALEERNYFLNAAPYLNKDLNLVISDNSFLKTAFWFYPGIFLYHLLYLKASFGNENSTESLPGPSVLSKGTLKKTLPGADQLHGQYGALMHEG